MGKSFKNLLLILMVIFFNSSVSVSALTKSEYQEMGLLPFTGEPYFKLGQLDKLGRPTWAHIQFHDFIDAKAAQKYENPKTTRNGNKGHMTDYLVGFTGNDDYFLIPSELEQGYMQKVWEPSQLLNLLWTDPISSNVARNYGLFTSYAYKGYPEDSREGLVTLQDYEQALDAWFSSAWDPKKGYKRYMIDYKIELIYQEQELVPRQIKIRYVGLTQQGELRKINLDGPEDFDKNGIATVIIDNIAPNVTIDYKTGKVEGNRYVPKHSSNSTDRNYDETEEHYVYINLDSGYYYYYVDNPDDYLCMVEKEALEEGYIWDSTE